MEGSTDTTPLWSEDHSQHFIELGRIYTPSRHELRDTMLSLIPAAVDESFLAVELGVGGGWLSAAILERFPRARVLGLDGSPAMLRETARLLAPFEGRFELRQFQLEDRSWLEALGDDARCFVSSLVIHHLDGPGKRQLYQDLFAHLDDRGAAILADLVAPRSEWERRSMASAWEAEVRRQSLEIGGSLNAYQQFVDDRWNLFEYPDPMDMPSTVPDHLRWLMEAGFSGVNVFWLRAGHAIYGGYKAPSA